EVVLLLADLHLERKLLAVHRELDVYGKSEWRRAVDVLRLLDAQLRLLRVMIPLEPELERRMPAAIHEFIEQPVDVAPCRAFDRALEVRCRDVRAAVLRDVMANRLPPAVVAEHRAHHVQHQRALFVQVTVEQVYGLVIDVVDNRPPIAVRVFAHVDLRVLVQLVSKLVAALVVLRKQGLEVRGEAFVEPAVRPSVRSMSASRPRGPKYCAGMPSTLCSISANSPTIWLSK